jgi:hypothetical protein
VLRVARVAVVSGLTTEILALATAAPVESVTLPRSVAVPAVCASAAAEKRTTVESSRNIDAVPPECKRLALDHR